LGTGVTPQIPEYFPPTAPGNRAKLPASPFYNGDLIGVEEALCWRGAGIPVPAVGDERPIWLRSTDLRRAARRRARWFAEGERVAERCERGQCRRIDHPDG